MHLPGLRVASASSPGVGVQPAARRHRGRQPGRSSSSTRRSTPARARSSAARSRRSARRPSSGAGNDVTIVATMLMVGRALAAADALAAEGIEAEVIDLRWLRPLDLPTVAASVAKTGRLVVAEEQVHAAGWGATVISELAQRGVGLGLAATTRQPARRLPDPVLAAARGPGRPVGRRHRRCRQGRHRPLIGWLSRRRCHRRLIHRGAGPCRQRPAPCARG